MEILHNIEAHALAVRPYLSDCPADEVMIELEAMAASPDLIMERPLYTPPLPTLLTLDPQEPETEDDIDPTALYEQVVVNRARLVENIQQALGQAPQVNIATLLRHHPLEQGLSELVVYLELSNNDFESIVDENTDDHVSWNITATDGSIVTRHASLQRVIFVRSA